MYYQSDASDDDVYKSSAAASSSSIQLLQSFTACVWLLPGSNSFALSRGLMLQSFTARVWLIPANHLLQLPAPASSCCSHSQHVCGYCLASILSLLLGVLCYSHSQHVCDWFQQIICSSFQLQHPAAAAIHNTCVAIAWQQSFELCQDWPLVGTPVSCVSCIIPFMHHCPR